MSPNNAYFQNFSKSHMRLKCLCPNKDIFILVTAILSIFAIGLGISCFIQAHQLAAPKKIFTIPLIDAPVDFTKKGFMEFQFSRKIDTPYGATAFLYINQPNYDLPPGTVIKGNAKILNSAGNVVENIELEKGCNSWGFPTMDDSSGTSFSLVNLPNDLGEYRLQITLNSGVPELPSKGLSLRASYMSSMPIFLEPAMHRVVGSIFIGVGIILALILMFVLWWCKRKNPQLSQAGKS